MNTLWKTIFGGKFSRKDYLIAHLIGLPIAFLVVSKVDEPIDQASNWEVALVIFFLLYALTIIAKRLRDIKLPSWLSLAVFLPLIGVVGWLALFLIPSKK